MTIQECYDRMGGDYDTILRRLRQEDRIVKFLRLFPKDTNYSELQKAVAAGDWALAFRCAHSLKGVSLNLAFARLSQSASDLTEALRNGPPAQDPAPLLEAVTRDYEDTTAAISAFFADAE